MDLSRTKARSFVLIVMAAAGASSCYEPPRNDTGNAVNYRSDNVENASRRGDRPGNSNTNMTTEKKAAGFSANLPTGMAEPSTSVEKTLLKEYGSVFVARGGVTPPSKIVFKDEADVEAFQAKLRSSTETVDGKTIELQSAAMDDLRKAMAEATAAGLTISPRDVDSAKRSYDETVGLWKSRVDPALKHWVGNGRLTQADAERIEALSPFEQVPEVLKLEESGIFFAKDLSKSIIYSVAPPGTSQHLSMLALDVKEFEDEKIRAILAKHNWYQTVVSDLPHFTYLGVGESELPSLGLKSVSNGGRTFWVPDL